MRAYAIDRRGTISDLRVRDFPKPVPAANELLVSVRAAALNPADLKVLAGRDGGGFLHAANFPFVLGFDFSGVVESIGASATGFAAGDEVFGFLPYARSTRSGAYAEYLTVSADAVGKKPKGLSHEEAASSATAAVTALCALREKGRLAAGQTVLINGASGGVGSFAVQIARNLGANVLAIASAAKADAVKSLGASQVFVYKTTPISEIKSQLELVVDVAANSSYGACLHLLKPGGAYVSLLPSPALFLGMARALFSSRRCSFVMVKPRASEFAEIARWFDAGTLKPMLDRAYPFNELPIALERLQRGDVRGKLALTIDESR